MQAITELEKRLKPLIENNIYYAKAFDFRYEIINGDSHQIDYIKEVNSWDRGDLVGFEKKILKLEEAKKEVDAEEEKKTPLRKRRAEYARIDHLLLEAMAEKENGRPEKMQEYLIKRKEIKDKYPKV